METRKAPRLPISTNAKITVDPAAKKQFDISKKEITAKILDIGIYGIGVSSRYFIPTGAIIDVEFTIADELIAVKGEVRSAISGGKGLTRLGVKFLDLKNGHKKLIDNLIKENERRTHPRLNI